MTTVTANADSAIPSDEAVIQRAYEDALDDVHTRFLLNLPPSELATSDRIFFQLEQAWWYYEDMICDLSTLALPRFKDLKPFCVKMFVFSPLFQGMDFHPMWAEFSAYKRQISTYGTILLNDDCTRIVLCQTWHGKTWTFPAGKINQGEGGLEAAARETYEETGFDPNALFGQTKEMKEQGAEIGWTCPIRNEDGLSFMDPVSSLAEGAFIALCILPHVTHSLFNFSVEWQT
jgi:hypothetical protein